MQTRRKDKDIIMDIFLPFDNEKNVNDVKEKNKYYHLIQSSPKLFSYCIDANICYFLVYKKEEIITKNKERTIL